MTGSQTKPILKAIIVGSINRDIVATVTHHPRPGETVLGSRAAFFPGGKGANQAVAIARLGGQASMIGRVGADAFGVEMRAFLTQEGVETSGIATTADAATGIALITVDAASENCITVIPGANHLWPAGLPHLAAGAGDIVICQLEVPLAIVMSTFTQARAAGARTLLNPAPFQPLPVELLAATDILILNEQELASLAGLPEPIDPDDIARLTGLATGISTRGPSLVVVTLGAAGAHLQARDQAPVRIPGLRVIAHDTTGAGDCFIGAFAAELLRGQSAEQAATFAAAAAALSVTRDGAAASFPNRVEAERFLHQPA